MPRPKKRKLHHKPDKKRARRQVPKKATSRKKPKRVAVARPAQPRPIPHFEQDPYGGASPELATTPSTPTAPTTPTVPAAETAGFTGGANHPFVRAVTPPPVPASAVQEPDDKDGHTAEHDMTPPTPAGAGPATPTPTEPTSDATDTQAMCGCAGGSPPARSGGLPLEEASPALEATT